MLGQPGEGVEAESGRVAARVGVCHDFAGFGKPRDLRIVRVFGEKPRSERFEDATNAIEVLRLIDRERS